LKRLLLILFFIVRSGMWAADYYVAKTGSNSNPGTEALPWKTIQKAADTLTAGDTVYIKAGTYKERVVPKKSGSAGNTITYTAYPGGTVTIDGTGVSLPSGWGGLLDISGKNHIKISGLRVMNAGPDDNNQGILVDGCNYIIIENNYTYNTVSSGIGIWNSSNVIIDNNEVELACNDGEQECITAAVTDTFEIGNNHVHHGGPGTNGGEGIDAKDGASNGKIYNNHVHHLNRLGIYVDAWDKHTYNIEVYGNLVHDIDGNDGFTLASEMGGLLENIQIYNNIAYNCDTIGFDISRNGDSPTHPMKNITVVNNTSYNNGTGGWGGGITVDNLHIEGVAVRNNIVAYNRTFQMVVDSSVPMNELTVDYNLIHGYRDYIDEIRGTDYVEGNPVTGEGSNMVYIGDALSVEGARPDIEAAFPGYPGNSRAGWGYMMLTNFLPDNGNGTFTVYAVATDNSGQSTTLGAKTITCDNAGAVKPFGAIDTPGPGGTASGEDYRNHGWVLTPAPNAIPADGTTINVYVDGVFLGHPVYNVYRPDIASLFPGYSNSNGAHAYFDIDTTVYSNGVHTIYWTVTDSAGNSEGIGSRYFIIRN